MNEIEQDRGAHRTYRIATHRIPQLVLLLVITGAVGLFKLQRDDMPTVGLVWCGIGWVVFCGLMLALVLRWATVVTPEGIVVRHITSTVEYPWSRIAEIKVENVGQVLNAVVYHGPDLERVVLPYVNPKGVTDPYRFEDEVDFLLDTWAAERGEDWQSRSADLDHAALARSSRTMVWLVAALVGIVSGLISFVILMIVLTNSSYAYRHSTMGELISPWLMVFGPGLAVGLTLAIGLTRRRKKLREAARDISGS